MSRYAITVAALALSVLSAQAVAARAQEAMDSDPGPDVLNPEAGNVTTGELLDRLFGQLHQARGEDQAKLIEQAIWKMWNHSGSPSTDLLLAQADKAARARAFPAAIAILDTVIEIQPDFAEAWNKRATTYYLMGRYDQSLADIEQVLELEPRHFGALAGRGMIMNNLGKKREALQAYRRALTIYPEMQGPKRAVKELAPEVEQDI